MIAICYPKDGWILQRLAEELLERIPECIGLQHDTAGLWDKGSVLDTGPQRINYFINYAVMRRTTSKLDAAWFTHPEDDGLFWDTARHVDLAVCNCDRYCRLIRKMGIDAETIIPGVDPKFTPKLILGFVGRFSSYGMRKGIDLLHQVADLDFVELMVTDGRLSFEELPAFYRKLDYVLVTSRYEGGPMSLLEGLACGKKVICPEDVGLAGQFPDGIVPYVNGNIASLTETLQNLFVEKQRLSGLVKSNTWDNWALQHLRLFTSLVQRHRSHE